MNLEPHPLPSQHGQLHDIFSYSSYNPYNHNIPVSLPYDLMRFYQEKDFLSERLADCATYLRALREKQTRNDHQLDADSALPPKKRKRLQQAKRYLAGEIRNREMEEQACLNNLQACETNIILANMKAYHLINVSSHTSDNTLTPILDTPTLCSYSGSEATDLAWDGWTDEASVSPFQKRASDPFLVEDPAPDVYMSGSRRDSVILKDVKRSPPRSRDAVELSKSLPVPPNTAQSQFTRPSILSPEAAAFRPTGACSVQGGDCARTGFRGLSMSNATATEAKELLRKRRFSAGEVGPVLQRLSIEVGASPEHLPGQMWCKSTPQQSSQEDTRVRLVRERLSWL